MQNTRKSVSLHFNKSHSLALLLSKMVRRLSIIYFVLLSVLFFPVDLNQRISSLAHKMMRSQTASKNSNSFEYLTSKSSNLSHVFQVQFHQIEGPSQTILLNQIWRDYLLIEEIQTILWNKSKKGESSNQIRPKHGAMKSKSSNHLMRKTGNNLIA